MSCLLWYLLLEIFLGCFCSVNTLVHGSEQFWERCFMLLFEFGEILALCVKAGSHAGQLGQDGRIQRCQLPCQLRIDLIPYSRQVHLTHSTICFSSVENVSLSLEHQPIWTYWIGIFESRIQILHSCSQHLSWVYLMCHLIPYGCFGVFCLCPWNRLTHA